MEFSFSIAATATPLLRKQHYPFASFISTAKTFEKQKITERIGYTRNPGPVNPPVTNVAICVVL
jgi:hypothetical protein